MPTISRFEELEIWLMAREQAGVIYALTKKGDFDLRNQIKASAGSVMDNIAEGFERNSSKEFSQFLVIAKGSNGEVRSRLYRACDRGYVNQEILAERQDYSNVLGRKIKAFIDYLGSSKYKGKPQKKD